MKFKFKPLILSAIVAVSASLTGCGGDDALPEKVDVYKDDGLWCKSPDIVQIASPDFYPLNTEEQSAYDTARDAAQVEAGDDWDETVWIATFNFYNIFDLTLEEKERQVIAKEDARAFKIEQGQDIIFGDDFDQWFDDWFDNVPAIDYLGSSTRLVKSVNGTTPEMNGSEICYTPPVSCPNYMEVDISGAESCIVPLLNPILDAPEPVRLAGANEAVAYYRHTDHVEGEIAANRELYKNIVIHTFNENDCIAYQETSISAWGFNSSDAQNENGYDDNYGWYWVLKTLDDATKCGNIIYNDTKTGKKISQTDLVMPLGGSDDIAFHNLDKNSYAHDDFPTNSFDGMLVTNQHPFFGASASGGTKSCGWGTSIDELGEFCLGQALECPDGYVAVGVGTVDIASKCVGIFDPATTGLLIRGGFNGWDGDNDPNSTFTYVSGGQYRLNHTTTSDCVLVDPVEASDGVEAVEGEDCVVAQQFKVADKEWLEPSSFGGILGGDTAGVGKTITMTVGSGVGQNMSVDFAASMDNDKIYQFLVNAADPTSVTLTINDVPVAAFPMLMIGDESVELVYAGNNQYVKRMTLTAETHSFTIADPDAEFALGAADNNVIELDTPYSLVVDGTEALSFTPDSAAEYDFVLDFNEAEPMLTIKPALPFGTDKVYIRGTVSGWGDPATEDDEILWNADNRSYSVIYGLEANVEQQFKFASQAWDGAKYDIGADQLTFSENGLPLSGDGNIAVTPAKSTSYQFSISYLTDEPTVMVQEAPLYLRGGITGTGWGADDGNQLMFVPTTPGNSSSASHIYSLEVNYGGGAAEFKVADGDWGGNFNYNYGVEVADTAVELGVALPLVNSNNNIKLDIPAGTYIFSFEDSVTKTITVTLKE
ncbi:MAG: hypothetical protein OCD00_12140 [Colwellia sp.]